MKTSEEMTAYVFEKADRYKKKKKNRIIKSVSLALIVCISMYIIVPLWIKRYKLNYDFERGGLALSIAKNAQYIPDLDKFIKINSQASGASAAAETNGEAAAANMKATEFAELIDRYGTIENYAGAGKYFGYDITEVKSEIEYVLANVPAFNQWFRMPSFDARDGFVAIPYYDNWTYYLEYDADVLSITRVSNATGSSYIDFDSSGYNTVQNYDDEKSFIQFEIMNTKYYFNEDGDEVVECSIYSVGVDNYSNITSYNSNTDDYYPFEYQYLKNVKDKSLIKYHITAAKRYTNSEGLSGMDIRGLNPYGIRREFIIVNYDGYDKIEVTNIDQQFATITDSSLTGEVDFDMNSDNILMLVKAVGLKKADIIQSEDCKQLMEKIAKEIVDNFELEAQWPEIFRNWPIATLIGFGKLHGEFYEESMPIAKLNTLMTFTDFGTVNFDAHATIIDDDAFDFNAEYSLSIAWQRDDGDLTVMFANYAPAKRSDLSDVEIEYGYIFGTNIYDISTKYNTFGFNNFYEEGEYTLVCVLTKKDANGETIMFNTKEPIYTKHYKGFTDVNGSFYVDGVKHYRIVSGRGGKITLNIISEQ